MYRLTIAAIAAFALLAGVGIMSEHSTAQGAFNPNGCFQTGTGALRGGGSANQPIQVEGQTSCPTHSADGSPGQAAVRFDFTLTDAGGAIVSAGSTTAPAKQANVQQVFTNLPGVPAGGYTLHLTVMRLDTSATGTAMAQVSVQ